ncbi:MAG: N-acetylmuramoyl-L-alanine amidase [Saprospiraceae bacterium]|nr:N-acetylmuramoyl-L-alanine amidase [Saprospiraceae bacterium]
MKNRLLMSMRKIIVFSLSLTLLLLLVSLLKPDKAGFNENLTSETTSIVDSAGKVTIPNDNDEKDYRIKKVVIDAGHGGHDTGCHSNEGVEKKNTLAMALKLGQKIKDNYPNIEIIYTRETDKFIELHRRAEIANKAKADLFISIHCNSTDENSGISGTETYVLGMHKKETNFEVARRENASILLESDYKEQYEGFDPNSTEAYIIFSLFQNAYLDKSILFAKYVEESFRSNAGRRSLGVKQAGFLVLKETAMPSVLIETGFLNHSREGEFISSASGQATIAESIFLAFQKYKTAVETREATPLIDPVTEGVVFKIQLATASKDLSQTPRWKSMSNLEVVKDGTIFKYFKTGFDTYNEASQELKRLRANGFSDAFIVAYKNGKRVNLEEVKK